MKEFKDVKSFEIDRDSWLRGEGGSRSCLLNDHGKMCCLGFYAQACGLEPQHIRKISSPLTAVAANRSIFVWDTQLVFNDHNTQVYDYLMQTNDCTNLSEEDREKK